MLNESDGKCSFSGMRASGRLLRVAGSLSSCVRRLWQVLTLRQQLHASEEAAGEHLARAMRRAAAAEGVLERVRPTTASLLSARRAADGGRWQAEEMLRAAASELRCLLGDMLPAPATSTVKQVHSCCVLKRRWMPKQAPTHRQPLMEDSHG